MGFASKFFGVSGVALVVLLIFYAMLYAASVQMGATAYYNETMAYEDGIERLDGAWEYAEQRAMNTSSGSLVWATAGSFVAPTPVVLRAGYTAGYEYPVLVEVMELAYGYVLLGIVLWVGWRAYRAYRARRSY